jgi:hypothetical protein
MHAFQGYATIALDSHSCVSAVRVKRPDRSLGLPWCSKSRTSWHPAPLRRRRRDWWNATHVSRVQSHRVGDALRVQQEGVPGKVGDIVPFLMVVAVVCYVRFAAVQGDFFRSLGVFSPSEQASGWDIVLEERTVVRSSVKGRRAGRDPRSSKEGFKVSFNLCRAWWAGKIECRSIAVIDKVSIVGRRNHVKVEVSSDLAHLAGRLIESGHVVLSAFETEFLKRL